MQLIRGLSAAKRRFAESGCALTIGNFDGVHLGHQAVLCHLRQKAREFGLPVAVLLFEPQPNEYFRGEHAPARLMRLRDKLHYLAQCGVDAVIVVKFDRTFAAMPAEKFIADGLVAALNVKFLSIGDDFRFGAKRAGDFGLLQKSGEKYGFTVEDNHSFCLDEQRISSTAVRQALQADCLTDAEALLGRPYRLFGRVIHGKKLGRTIGFPTANVRLHRRVSPISGVYAVKVRLKSGTFFYGVANIGRRPTVDNAAGGALLLEIHLFDFKGNLYCELIEIEICRKIRNERKFPSFDALKQQIAQDAETARAYFCTDHVSTDYVLTDHAVKADNTTR